MPLGTVPPGVAFAVAIGLNTLFAFALAIESGWVALRGGGIARLLVVGALVLVPLVALTGAAADVPLGVTLGAMWIPPVALVAASAVRTRRATLPGIADEGDRAILDGVAGARELLAVGDVEGWTSALEGLRARVTPATARYLDLWLQFAAEEAERRAGERISSRSTHFAIEAEAANIRRRAVRPPPATATIAIAGAVVVAVGGALILGATGRGPTADACSRASLILDGAEAAPVATFTGDRKLSDLVLVDPGFEVILEGLEDHAIGLQQAAGKTADPTAKDKLASAGYVDGWFRYWVTPGSQRPVSAEILEFETPAGAARYHRQISEFACLYADEAFAGTHSALGLQLRYSDPDPVVEQIAWVDGVRRVVVTRGFGEKPPDHSEILAIATRADSRLAGQP